MKLTNLACGLLTLLILAPGLALARAEDKKIKDGVIEVSATIDFDPEQVTGLLLSSTGAIEKADPKVTKRAANSFLVTFPYKGEEIRPDTVATAMFISSNGKAAMADVHPVFLIESLNKSHLSLPNCSLDNLGEEAAKLSALYNNRGVLQSLIEIRTSRRDLAKIKVAGLMQGDLLSTLRQIEKTGGFTYTKELSSDLEPYELLQRLYRIELIWNQIDKMLETKKTVGLPKN